MANGRSHQKWVHWNPAKTLTNALRGATLMAASMLLED